MKQSWDQAARKLFGETLASQMKKGCIGLTLLAVALFPAFAYLDYLLYPNLIDKIWPLRFATFVFFLIMLIFQWKATIKRPFAFAYVLLLVAAISITGMCMIVGGHESPYYAGVNLAVLAGVVVLPLGWKKMSLVVASMISTYVYGILLAADFNIPNPAPLVNNLYFMIATGIIVITAAHMKQETMVESFDRMLQIKRSADLLKLDLQTEQGNVESLVREITLRKHELEKALLIAQAAKNEAQLALNLREEFISLASHELNTPLTSLVLQTQVAKHKVREGKELNTKALEKLISTYDYQLQRLIKIVSDMLDVTKISVNKFELVKSEVDLGHMLEELIERTSDKFQYEGCQVKFDSQDDVKGTWDLFRIEQVFLNLFTNAMKYGTGRQVEVSLKKDESHAHVSVRDYGIGISEEAQKRIFNRFERAVLSKEFTGLGLGLYISKQIVDAHEGEITVESIPGEGSTFKVKLPLMT